MPKTIHPTSRTLLAYLDGELPFDERSEIRTHVNECNACREELDTMEADLDWFLVLEAASRSAEQVAPAGGLNRLLSATRAWQRSNEEAAVMEQERRRSVEKSAARALEICFGPSVAAAVQTQGEAEAAQSLLATFLGKRAADALMTDLKRGNRPRLIVTDLSS